MCEAVNPEKPICRSELEKEFIQCEREARGQREGVNVVFLKCSYALAWSKDYSSPEQPKENILFSIEGKPNNLSFDERGTLLAIVTDCKVKLRWFFQTTLLG